MVCFWLLFGVAGSAVQTISLDGDWSLSSDAGHRLTGRVPGDLITDLEMARIVADPYYELGFLNNGCAGLWMKSKHGFSQQYANKLATSGQHLFEVGRF